MSSDLEPGPEILGLATELIPAEAHAAVIEMTELMEGMMESGRAVSCRGAVGSDVRIEETGRAVEQAA